MPIPENLQDHYGIPPESYWIPSYFEWNDSYFNTEIEVLKKLQPFQQGMKALDVGAGIGKSMISMEKAGYEVYGFEPAEPFYQRAIEKMGIHPEKLKLGMIENVDYPEASFDFITFGAVFEHLYHPAASLEKALHWAKKQAIIQIEVPSADYFISKLINTNQSLNNQFKIFITQVHDVKNASDFFLLFVFLRVLGRCGKGSR